MNGTNRSEKKKKNETERRNSMKEATERLREALRSVPDALSGLIKKTNSSVRADVYKNAIDSLTALWQRSCAHKREDDGLQSLSTVNLERQFVESKDNCGQHGGRKRRLQKEKKRRAKEKLCIDYLKKLIVAIRPQLSVRSTLQQATVIDKTAELIQELCESTASIRAASESSYSAVPPSLSLPQRFVMLAPPTPIPSQFVYLPFYSPYRYMTTLQVSPSDSGYGSTPDTPSPECFISSRGQKRRAESPFEEVSPSRSPKQAKISANVPRIHRPYLD